MNSNINLPINNLQNAAQSGKVLGIRGRLILGFSAIITVLLVAIIFVIAKITFAENFAINLVDNEIPTHDTSFDLKGQIYREELAMRNWILFHDAKSKAELSRAMANIDKLVANMDALSKNWTNNEYIKNWQDVKSLLNDNKAILAKYANNEDSTNILTNLNSFVAETTPFMNKILDILDGPLNAQGERSGGMFDVQLKELQKDSHAIVNDMNTIRLIEYALLVISILASIIIGFYTSRGILEHINRFRVQSSRIATGDLTQRLNVLTDDEVGQLGIDLNKMTEGLATITKQITQACHSMVTTLEEVKRAVDVQSSGASEQASSINQITASLEEIEKSSSQTMEKAKSLGEVAERTREKGQQGLEAVEQSISGMKTVREKVQTIAQTILELSHQTQQVGEITAVVNRLAQQSKMLALNASIEAAKAGEAGKGFSVVAVEVKNLAEQSEQSTTQVQKILEDIRHATEKAVMATEEGTKGVDQGTGLVEQTGDIVRSLSDVIHETTIASQQIEAAIRQEGIGIEQITAGMGEINQVTSSFVASVKQTTEAMENLATITKNLKEYIDVYKV